MTATTARERRPIGQAGSAQSTIRDLDFPLGVVPDSVRTEVCRDMGYCALAQGKCVVGVDHVFRAGAERCPRCGGPLRWAELATGEAVQPLLNEHDLAPRAPPVRGVPLGQLELSFVG